MSGRAPLELVAQHRVHGGWQRIYRHDSREIGLPMRFAVFAPDGVPGDVSGTRADAGCAGQSHASQSHASQSRPALFYLAGLTCTEETFPIKAGAQRLASELGLMLIAPDTSPRGAGVAGEDDSWDFGTGAGFYLDATEPGWREHYRMASYVVNELVDIAVSDLQADSARLGIFGHSMGGHGALVLAQRHPDVFRSVSAFAPVAAPSRCPWGKKAFTGYLGADAGQWSQWDASALMQAQTQPPFPQGILIDQGLADTFLDEQLYPDVFEQACRQVGQPLELRRHEGFDHGYYFISTFIDDHIRFHAERLAR